MDSPSLRRGPGRRENVPPACFLTRLPFEFNLHKYPYQPKIPPFGGTFGWWGKVDSNHRRHRQQIYSLSPLATREFPHMNLSRCENGAGGRTRTPDLLITNQLLYRLSYTSTSGSVTVTGPQSPFGRLRIIAKFNAFVNTHFEEKRPHMKSPAGEIIRGAFAVQVMI